MPRILAIYLPQFHPIPENDAWWGRGFTEWTNVTRARPLFREHYQPHLPADLGFYDLRVPEVREAQASLAAAHGIHGFCYYHYWFKGKRLLERPFNEVLDSGRPDFPFCLCWANETWSRRWLGEEKEVLVAQDYSRDDDDAHALWLMRAFGDPRYVRVAGRPVFLIYRPLDLPEPARTVEILRTTAARLGLPDPYLVGVDSHAYRDRFEPLGFDNTLRFHPQLGVLPRFQSDGPTLSRLRRNARQGVLSPSLKVYSYRQACQAMTETAPIGSKIPCVFVGWDNTPRRGAKGVIMVGSSPSDFGAELELALDRWRKSSPACDLLFVNAWNEWAEGNHLEPDQRYGLGFLERVRAALKSHP